MKQNLPSINAHPGYARNLLALGVLLLLIYGSVKAQPTMLSEIASGSKSFVNINGTIYYASGDNLYKANTTTSPTLVKTTGQTILQIYNYTLNGNFFFVTQSGSGQALWRSNGTSAGTAQVASNTNITPLLVYNSGLYLSVNSPTSGIELWKMDAGYNVTILKDINPGAANGYVGSLIAHNNLLYFFANAGAGQDLWRSDGTTGGTVMTVDLDDEGLYNFSGFRELTSVNDIMFFTWYYEGSDDGEIFAELWKTDGTQTNTSRVSRWTGGYSYNFISNLIAFKGKLYFFHNYSDPIYTYFSVSDGTSTGTKHIDLTSIDGGPRQMINAGDYLVYYSESQGNKNPIEKSDGTTVSTVHQFSYYNNASDQEVQLTATGGRVFFIDDITEFYSGDRELWQADLAAGVTTSLNEKYGESYSGSANIVADNGNIYFTRNIFGKLTLWYYNPNSPSGPPTCSTAGFIEREKWNNVSGASVSAVPVNTQPNAISVLSNFSTTRNEGDNYGARVRGYICAPETGNYTFYISSDDNSELWLSTDDNPSNKRLVASSKWTAYNEWTKYPTQTSAEIALVQGTKYYIEALHKESAGADHLSVGWKLPSGLLERPIAGNRLSPFERNQPPRITILEPADGATYIAPATIDITAFVRDAEGAVAKVSFYNSGTLLGEATAYPYTYRWQNVPAGTYTIEARVTDSGGYTASDFQTVTVSPGCSATGTLYREMWLNVTGTDVRAFDFSKPTTGAYGYLSDFETGQYQANNYASRIRGYVCVPQPGNYTFWISSDDQSEFYLSTDESETNKRLIAWVYGATKFRDYGKYPSQKSVQVSLQAGYKYYFEARHKEGTGNDFVSVGWQLPDGTTQFPIAANHLIGIRPAENNGPSITITSPTQDQRFDSTPVYMAADVTDPDGVQKVTFEVEYGSSTTTLATFTKAPYQFTWNDAPASSYVLNVRAWDARNTVTIKSVRFSVDQVACSGTGKVYREIWTGISGTSVSAIPVNTTPNKVVELSSLSTPNYYGNDYGSRIRGYICPPATGWYNFYISGDDNSELWLSNNGDPAGKSRIAYVSGATSVNQWNKYNGQISSTIYLSTGQRYYFEVLHKEANGADHVEVGWANPVDDGVVVIPGNRLMPYEDLSTSAASFGAETVWSENPNEEMSVYPNPVVNGRSVTISLPDVSESEVQVDIISATGVSLQTEQHGVVGQSLTMDLKPSIVPGMYLIKVMDSRKRWVSKIQVK